MTIRFWLVFTVTLNKFLKWQILCFVIKKNQREKWRIESLDNFRFEDDGFNWYKNNKIIEEIIAVLKWKKMKSTNKTVRKPREMNMIYKKQNEMDENKKIWLIMKSLMRI